MEEKKTQLPGVFISDFRGTSTNGGGCGDIIEDFAKGSTSEAIQEEIKRLETSIVHLKRSNVELEEILNDSKLEEKDQDLMEAVTENIQVIEDQQNRIHRLQSFLRGVEVEQQQQHQQEEIKIPKDQDKSKDEEDGVYL